MEKTDRVLIEEISAQKEEAFKILYDRYVGLFYKIAFSCTDDKEMAEDIMQNFWLTIWTDPQKLRTDTAGSAKSFLYKHFSFCVSNYLRSAFLRKKVPIDEIIELREDTFIYHHILEELENKEIVEIINKAIEDMPEIVRVILNYSWKENLTIKEIGHLLNMSDQSIRNKYQWGIGYLRKRLKTSWEIDLYIFILFYLIR